MANSLSNVSVRDLKRAIKIKAKLENLQARLNEILSATATATSNSAPRNRMSAAARKRIGAAQRARWAKLKGKGTVARVGKKPRCKMSAAGRARIAAAAKARWAKAKAEGKNSL